MGASEEYQLERYAAVACGAEGPENCRHEWNAAHPDDPVTKEEQEAFTKSMYAALEKGKGDSHEV